MIALILTLALVGFLSWLITTYVPMDAWIKRLIQIVAIVCIVLYLLNAFGLLRYDVPVPQVR
jgi:hypothetical protein